MDLFFVEVACREASSTGGGTDGASASKGKDGIDCNKLLLVWTHMGSVEVTKRLLVGQRVLQHANVAGVEMLSGHGQV